jgi:DNA-binding NtrC family response regulator
LRNYRVLVVDDEADMLQVCRRILEEKSYIVSTASDGPEALELLRRQPVDVAVVDLRLPSMDGLEVMHEALQLNPDTAVLIITAHATLDAAVQAVRHGAFDLIAKPFSASQLEVAVERSVSYRKLLEQNRALQRELRKTYQFDRVLAHSWQMTSILDLVRKVAPTEANVLLRGESGTGKELIARCLHQASSRSHGPFVPIDCASLPETLLESELFGYEKGAFTGASASRAGLLEAASGGTVFLDEIGNVSPNLQAKLLRVLEEHHYRRVGGRTLIELNARFVSATNSALEEAVQRGSFREDLFYRLNVVSICLPPLRERPADLAPLAQSFLEENPDVASKGIRGISSAALMMMQNYGWPGNVRELKNVIWRAVSLTESNQIMPLDLPPELLNTADPEPRMTGRFRQAKQQAVEQFEGAYLRQLMEEAAGNVSQAARQAGMRRPALHRLLHKHGLDASKFRPRH